jgi:hypothetical protein
LELAAWRTLVVGGDSVVAMWQWAARAEQGKLRQVGTRCDPLTGLYQVLSELSFRRVLTEMDTDCARTEAGRVFLVDASDHASGAVLGQLQVPDKRGEGPAARRLLPQLSTLDMAFTLDALHITKTTADGRGSWIMRPYRSTRTGHHLTRLPV